MLLKIKLGKPGLPTKRVVLACIGILFIFFLFFWHLGTLTPGMSKAEIAARSSSSFSAITDNPVYAPHKLVQFLFIHFNQTGAFWMRLPSAIFALLVLFAFYSLLKDRFGKFISFLGLLFLASTPLIVILARSATPEIMLLFPVLVFACYNYLTKAKNPILNESMLWLLLVLLVAIGLYIPLTALVLLVALIFSGKRFARLSLKMTPVTLTLGSLIFLAVLAPLILAVAKTPSLTNALFALPDSWLSGVELVKSFAWSILALVWRTPQHIPYIVGHLPIFDIAQVTLAGIGLFVLFGKFRKGTILLLMCVFLSAVTAAINKDITLLVITIPIVSFFVAAGLRFMYIKWFSVFPKNPVPRGLALMLMSLLVIFQVTYGVRYALVAWPNTLDTKKVYVLK